MTSHTVILDCDPGHDDAMALYMLLASPNVTLAAVTTSAGNQTQDKTSRNARALLKLAGRSDIPVGRGTEEPLRRALILADTIHGETGLDGADLPDVDDYPIAGTALEVLTRMLREARDPIDLVATGPLTNIATLLVTHPQLKDKIRSIHYMGGAIFGGNWTSTAEFNIFVDPEAADFVVNSGLDIYMYGLDVTLQAQMFQDDIDQVRAIGGLVAETIAGLLDYFHTTVSQPFLVEEGHVEGLHLHDPCAAAGVINPSMFTYVPLHVTVDTREGPTLGMTIGDYMERTGNPPNVNVAFKIDQERMLQLVMDTLRTLTRAESDTR